MVDAIREILGLRPLYAVDCADETAVRIAQDRIDAVAGHSARKGIEHPNSTIDDWRID